jgi:hypothetical protein
MTGPDLVRATSDVKARAERVAVTLNAIVHQGDPMFRDPRSVFMHLTIAGHELEAATRIMRLAWWP